MLPWAFHRKMGLLGMAKDTHAIFATYLLMLEDPANIDKTRGEYAKELGVGHSTVWRWDRQVDWDAINTKRREAYARVMPSVDSALLKKAQKGDAEAIKLFYARFDGYVPVSGTIDLSDKKDDELRKRADEIKAELLRERVGPDQPGT